MQTTDYLRTMCRYNAWMNDKLYEVCATMPDELRKEDKGAFFKSMHGILNHLLLADRIWLGRFTGVPFPAQSLDQELYSDFYELRAERRKTDAAIAAWIETLDDAKMAADFTFMPMSNPNPITKPMWLIVVHMFNHQTHHRGQLTTLMSQCGYDSGATDLPVMPLEL